jgi:ATP citrate (pro-S)-lyase
MYQADPEIQMIVLLGEVGGRDELDIVDMLEKNEISKPIVAYVAGSFAERLSTPVQFGHAGAKANADEEKATYKNNALRTAGAYVPTSYAGLGDMIQQVYEE